MPEIFGIEYREEPWGCWVRPTHRGKRRYYQKVVKGKAVSLHKHVWELSNQSSVLKGIEIRHKCDYPPCFNPLHLEIGTSKQNAQDRTRKPICNAPRPTERIATITLTDETYKAIKHILADEGGNVRAFCVAAVEDAVKRKRRVRALADPPRD